MTTQPKDFVITESAGTCGCVTYWRSGPPISIEALRDAWVAAGLDMELFRKAPEPVTAFRRAVLAQADRKTLDKTSELRTLVRPQAEPHTWAIVEEFVQEGKPPVYTTIALTSFAKGDPEITGVDGTAERCRNLFTTIMDMFATQSGTFAPEDITTWLVRLAEKKNAVTLRDTGGVYFIPRDSMDFWNKAAEAVETASKKTHRVFRIPAVRNSEAVDAIVDAVTVEAEQISAKIDAEVFGDTPIGERAVETRRANIDALLAKLSSYEALLGRQLSIRERAENLRISLAQRLLVDSAPPEEGADATP